MNNYKNLYEVLLENGELKMFLPKFKGTWEEDSSFFIKMQKEIEDSFNFIEIEDAEDIN